MRVLIAPQAFKGSVDAIAVAAAIAGGLRRSWPDAICDQLPLADGGEGTVRALVHATSGRIERASVHDPLGRKVQAEWGMLGDRRTAVVEMAAASGLPLLAGSERDARRTSTFGTGELILAAAASGAERVIVGIGGSATNDGGAGMARAFGFRFLDGDGAELPEGGAALGALHRIEGQIDPRLTRVRLEVACDVRNPLLGPEGASAVYGPQKGAGPEAVEELDRALTRYADVVERFLGRDVREVPGAGAAGGLGAGLLAFADARLRSGAELVMSATSFEKRAREADLIVTGEGRLDAQSAYGKVTGSVVASGRRLGVPVVAVVGSIGPGHDRLLGDGLAAIEVLVRDGLSEAEAMARGEELIAAGAARLSRSVALADLLGGPFAHRERHE